MQFLRLSRIIHRTGRLDRGSRRKIGMPARQTGVALAPNLFSKAEIEIGQCAPDPDMSDVECVRHKRLRLALETVEHGRAARRRASEMDVRRLFAQPLIAREHQQIEKTVAQRLTA